MYTFLITSGIILGLLSPLLAHAFEIGDFSSVCGIVPCSGGGGGAAGFSGYIAGTIVPALEVGIIAVALISLFYSAAMMSLFSSEEGAVKDARTSYIYVITGLAITGFAHWISLAFAPANTGGGLVNEQYVVSGVDNVVFYFRIIVAVTLLVNIVVQAFRVIASQGKQEDTDKAKKRLIGGFIGAGVIMLANSIVASAAPGFGATTIAAQEMAGIASYITTLVGFMAVLAIVVAGVMLIVSADEGLKDKAKNVVKTAVVALIACFVSYALITAFIFLQ